jgi:hypothetical protein
MPSHTNDCLPPAVFFVFCSPFGTTTQFVGATSVADCQIPPGYFISITSTSPVDGVLTACPNGTYRSGWTLYTDAKARDSTGGTTACTACGAGILSEATDIDERDGGNNTDKLVAGSSFSCWIPAGWGMVPTGVINDDNTLQYAATVCANNTYGVANKTYGLQSTPCKVSIRRSADAARQSCSRRISYTKQQQSS